MSTKPHATDRAKQLVADGFLTYFQAADWLACSRRTVCELVARGELPTVALGKVGSMRPRRAIPLAALREYAAGLLGSGGDAR